MTASHIGRVLENLHRRGLVDVDPDALATAVEHWSRGHDHAADASRRWQDDVIIDFLAPGTSVLDLGCGRGELLARLRKEKRCRIQGVELDLEEVQESVARGVPVVQADLDEGLKGFADASFDAVILEETLQTLHQPALVLEEMLRVARRCLVSFPNFAYWRVRLDLAFKGRMPMTGSLPAPWHSTPNIHLLTAADFRDWCAEAGVDIVEAHVLAEGEVRPWRQHDNREAEEVLFVIRRPRFTSP